MLSASLFTAFAAALNLLFLLAGIYIYVSLIRQVRARRLTEAQAAPAGLIAPGPTRTFGLPEAILAAALVSLMLANLISTLSHSRAAIHMSNWDVLANSFLAVLVVLFIVGFLRLRRLDLNLLGGFSKISFLRAASTGAILLIAAWPLLLVAEALMQSVFGGGSSKQEIVDLFNGSQTLQQRIVIIIVAVAIAPAAEEFIFRFFLYGVLKRYFGVFFGLVANALLFAAVHAHLPSFAPLLVLGICFTLAYEWSGSILVSMTMHSLFNSLTLIILAFPELFQQ
jgi:membrane protease YdiL (CAAX protease family)